METAPEEMASDTAEAPAPKKKAARKKTAAKKTVAKKRATKKKAAAKKAAPSVPKTAELPLGDPPTEKAATPKKKRAPKKKLSAKEAPERKEREEPPAPEKMDSKPPEPAREPRPDKAEQTERPRRNNQEPRSERPPRDHGEDGDRPPRRRKRRERRPRRRRGGSRNQDGGENSDHPSERGFEKRERGPIELGPPRDEAGLLEISPKGFGFLRQRKLNFKQTPADVFVTPEMIRQYGLRDGLWLEGTVQDGRRGPQFTELKKINGVLPDRYKNLPIFEELKAVNPSKRIILETDPRRYTTRIIDMMSPIGRGQRGLIVAPPRTGKTTLLQHIAEAVTKNHPEMKLILLLVDERPEEVTELSRELPEAEVFASSNDSNVKNHTRIAEVAIERAKRYVEAGEHVFMLLDSITRLGRAFNNNTKGKGRTGSGGLDVRALEVPRRLFAAARNTREAGSLTIVATALIDTGSRADEVIFQEFKGTGNMELVLDRQIANQYIYPAVDIFKTGTRREELLLPAHQLDKIFKLRRGLAGHRPAEAVERLLHFCERFPSNNQMLLEIPG